jgi:hypothetical protein
MPGIYLGVLVVAGLRYVRTREPRLLFVLLFVALVALAQQDGLRRCWEGTFHLAAGLAGCALTFALAPHPPQRP